MIEAPGEPPGGGVRGGLPALRPGSHRSSGVAAVSKTLHEAEAPARPARAALLWQSAVGKKALMAVSGFVLFLYVLVHMGGNLQAFAGAVRLDRYALQLRAFPVALWGIRLVLLVALVVHVVAGFELWAGRERTRPVAYRDYRPSVATPQSRTMIWTGFLILGFAVYHLLDLTFGVANPDFRPGEVFHNVVVSFGRGAAVAFYVLAVAGLGMHLWHGLWSMFSSLGLARRGITPALQRSAAVVGTVLAVGFAAVPLAVLFGILR
jgi:succinate dehydrogenase / fumarate reductase cytochrome b subunit